MYQGAPGAMEALARAEQRVREAPQCAGRDRARLHTFEAAARTRSGDLEGALEAYLRALDVAERTGLEADLPIYLLNVGTAHHRQGKLGLAREYYARGTRQSVPSTRASTRALLLANQANIDLVLGRVAEARATLADAGQVLEGRGLPLVEVFVQQLGADADAEEGALDRALEAYEEAARLYAAHGDSKHQAELLLKAADVALEQGAARRARARLDEARAQVEAGGHHDLGAHCEVLEGWLLLTPGRAEVLTGVERCCRGLEAAAEGGDRMLVLRNAARLIERVEAEGMAATRARLGELVARAWREVTTELPTRLRRDLEAHLARRFNLRPEEARPGGGARGGASGADVDPERFYRMLSLNARIINEPDLSRLLPAAMEIALSLSGAERGFVLLRSDEAQGAFEVALSRDVDGAPIRAPHLEVSLTIARQVARSGAPIVTVNARSDERFNEALSVHRLQLSSVLCVPICDRDEVLGTLYLDHRYRPDMFTGEAPRMMRAFADQVALALVGARRLARLEREHAALEEAQARIEGLLREKEAFISDLQSRNAALESAVEDREAALQRRYRYDQIIASSRPMQGVFDLIDRVVDNRIPVLITGESGTGKELVARAIHFNGARAGGPFVAFNCGALSESLSESELFGHERGAFTGAERRREGLFAAAQGGTLLLDEVGELAASIQVKLLRALQEGRVRPVGATREQAIDARIVAATNRDLEREVAEGRFREDLYWRLAALTIRLPALEERRDDIPLLVRHLLVRFKEHEGLPGRTLHPEALALLYHARWPGNIRQLENTLRTACVLSGGVEIGPEVLAPLIDAHPTTGAAPRSARGRKVKATRREVAAALERARGSRQEAAAALGVSERTLYRYIKRYRLDG